MNFSSYNLNKELVKNLNSSDAIKAYMATQIEFDRSLELLISELKKAKNVDIIASLNKEQQKFKDSLEDRLKFNKNGNYRF